MLADGVMEGRRIFANTLKYVLMATSSNFGNMFSAAGASLFLSFLPMLPSQILLNNLLYDVGQLAIPTDRVDPEIARPPAAWDIAFVRRFMSVFGPISSIFDFIDVLRHAERPPRQPRRVPDRLVRRIARHPDPRRVPDPHPSRPVLPQPPQPADDHHPDRHAPRSAPSCRSLDCPTSSGFTTLPLSFFLILVAMIVTYLALVEIAKSRFYARERDGPSARRRPTRSGSADVYAGGLAASCDTRSRTCGGGVDTDVGARRRPRWHRITAAYPEPVFDEWGGAVNQSSQARAARRVATDVHGARLSQ